MSYIWTEQVQRCLLNPEYRHPGLKSLAPNWWTCRHISSHMRVFKKIFSYIAVLTPLSGIINEDCCKWIAAILYTHSSIVFTLLDSLFFFKFYVSFVFNFYGKICQFGKYSAQSDVINRAKLHFLNQLVAKRFLCLGEAQRIPKDFKFTKNACWMTILGFSSLPSCFINVVSKMGKRLCNSWSSPCESNEFK